MTKQGPEPGKIQDKRETGKRWIRGLYELSITLRSPFKFNEWGRRGSLKTYASSKMASYEIFEPILQCNFDKIDVFKPNMGMAGLGVSCEI